MSDDPSRIQNNGSPGITLVLGGGGARGLAHFGVFKVLERETVPIRAIVGNSAGALAAAVYLQSPGAEAAAERTLEYLEGPRFQRHNLAFRLPRKNEERPPTVVSRLLTGWRRQVAMHLLFRRQSLFHGRRLRGVLQALVEDVAIEELSLPLHVVAIDLENGEEVVLSDGPLIEALMASCSVAGFFPPVECRGRVLIDAGQSDNLPVQIGRALGAGPVVAVNLNHGLDQRRDFHTGIEVMFRSEELGTRWNARLRLREADVVVAPDLKGRYWLDFTEPAQVVAAGEEAAEEAVVAIRRLVQVGPPERSSLDPQEGVR